jgi:cyclic beta-1,2-glucan synthetase
MNLMINTMSILEPQPPVGPTDTVQRLHNAANAAASWDVVHRPSSPGTFERRLQSADRSLALLDLKLAKQADRRSAEDTRSLPLQPTLRELRAEMRLLRALLAAANSRRQKMARLPRIIFSDGREEPRIAVAARIYLNTVDGAFAISTFTLFVHTLQTYEPLTAEELWNSALLLQLVLLESVLNSAHAFLRSPRSNEISMLSVYLKSALSIQHTDWNRVIEPLIVFDATLRQDPERIYEKMDFESRQLYRKRVAFVARQSDCTETEVAQAVLKLARDGAQHTTGDLRMQRRHSHVGYYLIDKGFPQLVHLVGFHPPVNWRIRQRLRTYAEDSYLGGILLASFGVAAAVLFPILPQFATISLLVVVFLMLVIPAVQNAAEFINHCITAMYDPEPLPKLDFSEGVPPDCATLVAVPSLLLNEKQVRELVHNLEVRFLANRDQHLHYALLTDLPDSVTKPRDRDSHPLVELAVELIGELNDRYSSQHKGAFLILHRHRIFNTRQGVWMSWERKRGKLLDLNKLLAGEFDAFPIKAGRIDVLQDIRYILTLDADTQLPSGTAARLTGTIAHPLNQAIIDPKLRIVTTGYGILQPRVGIAVRSAARSRLAAIFSGHGGFDIYSRAISDAYQDLFGEGIFTGKGIYEVATLHAVLNHRFPRNALLSHDLIEGAYARVALVSDVELIDDYPSHYGAYSRRQHRWVRGDWQIAQWMFSEVPDETGRLGPNPISVISRWKIFDNLLRSLIDPSLVVLFVAGWLGLPGGPLYWTIAVLFLLFFPAAVQIVFGSGRAIAGGNNGQWGEALSAFGRTALVRLLRLSLLLHQTWLTCDAVFRSLIRRFVTGERLLEWETSAEAELQTSRRAAVGLYFAATILTALVLAVAVQLFAARHNAIFYAAPILVMWCLSSFVTTWLDRPPDEKPPLSPSDNNLLMEQALRAWHYFLQFSSTRHNYLIPDNVEEDGLVEAPRVSPTNIGMLLNARQTACEFGFLTTPEFASLTSQTLATIQRLEKFRGNLYNWYDTQSLQPLHPIFISTVDSANYVASLYTLHAGVRELRRTPLLRRKLFLGLRVHWHLMRSEADVPPELSRLTLPPLSAKMAIWIDWIGKAKTTLSSTDSRSLAKQNTTWFDETLKRLEAAHDLLHSYLPWMLPEYAPLRERLPLAPDALEEALSIEDAAVLAEKLTAHIADDWPPLTLSPPLSTLACKFRESLVTARNHLHELTMILHAIQKDAENLAEATEFSFLIHGERQILSIGYDLAAQRVHDSSYDLFASEARLATFLAIARGDLPLQSWFKLDREQAYAASCFLPFSWTGTAFEYLMPGLWMRSYRDTLVAVTESACVQVQRAFGRSLGVPWGISESGSARKDDAGHYLYHAYGLPQIALSPDATAGPVISPYSTFLALGADPRQALLNLHRMKSAGWIGAYGFYEAADYTASLCAPVLVREWMAHHQGMSLLAIANLFFDHVVQRWFHANSIIQANELLLHEMPVSNFQLRARRKELALRGRSC